VVFTAGVVSRPEICCDCFSKQEPGLTIPSIDGWRLWSRDFSTSSWLARLVDAAVVSDDDAGREALGAAI
jgi:hypothetical protein